MMNTLVLILLISAPICIYGKVFIGPASDETEVDYPVEMGSFTNLDFDDNYQSHSNHVHRVKRGDVTAPLVHALNPGKHYGQAHPETVVTRVEGAPVRTQYAPIVHVRTPVAHPQ